MKPHSDDKSTKTGPDANEEGATAQTGLAEEQFRAEISPDFLAKAEFTAKVEAIVQKLRVTADEGKKKEIFEMLQRILTMEWDPKSIDDFTDNDLVDFYLYLGFCEGQKVDAIYPPRTQRIKDVLGLMGMHALYSAGGVALNIGTLQKQVVSMLKLEDFEILIRVGSLGDRRFAMVASKFIYMLKSGATVDEEDPGKYLTRSVAVDDSIKKFSDSKSVERKKIQLKELRSIIYRNEKNRMTFVIRTLMASLHKLGEGASFEEIHNEIMPFITEVVLYIIMIENGCQVSESASAEINKILSLLYTSIRYQAIPEGQAVYTHQLFAQSFIAEIQDSVLSYIPNAKCDFRADLPVDPIEQAKHQKVMDSIGSAYLVMKDRRNPKAMKAYFNHIERNRKTILSSPATRMQTFSNVIAELGSDLARLQQDGLEADARVLLWDIVKAEDDCNELIGYLALNDKLNINDQNELSKFIARKIAACPNAAKVYSQKFVPIGHATPEQKEATGGHHLERIGQIFSVENMQANPSLLEGLVKELVNPDYQTWYNACCIIGCLLESNSISTVTLGTQIVGAMDRIDEKSIQVLNSILFDICQRISAPRADVLHKTMEAALLLPKKPTGLTQSQSPKMRLSDLPQRNIPELIAHIISNRSSHISSEGNKINLSDIDSPLMVDVQEVKVTKNKETGKDPKGLACFVTIKSTENGAPQTAYLRITQSGDLLFRQINKQGALVCEDTCEAIAARENTPIAYFREIQWIALKALSIVYVRERSSKLSTANSSSTDSSTDTDQSAHQPYSADTSATDSKDPVAPTSPTETTQPPQNPENLPAILAPGMPLTAIREEGEMKMDLTTSEKAEQAKRARQEKIKVESNKGKTINVFKPLARGEELSEQAPAEIEELILHKKIVIGGKEFYETIKDPIVAYYQIRAGELNPQDVYVRDSRAFSTPLPYRYQTRYPGDDTNAQPYLVVNRNKMSDEARFRHDMYLSEGNEPLKTGAVQSILSFKVDDTPHNRALQSAVRSENLESAKIDQIDFAALARVYAVREAAVAEFGEYSPKVKEASAREWALIESETAADRQIALDIAERAREAVKPVATPNGISNVTELFLPQAGFEFDQTFNQGQFQSLKELLGL